MTVTTPPPPPRKSSDDEEKKASRQVALWSAMIAFFGNLIAVKVVVLISSGQLRVFGEALVTSIIIAAGIYARERYADAKYHREQVRKNA